MAQKKTSLAVGNAVYKTYAKRHIKSNDFTIICNNCYGGHLYESLNIPYRTPTVGLYFFAEDYINLISDLQYNLNSELQFIPKSRHAACHAEHAKLQYPIGLINDSIEVHLLHYKSEEEAYTKCNRRIKRINWNKLLVIMNDQNNFETQMYSQFDSINYPKVFLSSSKKYPKAVHIKHYKDKKCVGDMYNDKLKVFKDFDLVKWVKSNI